MIWQYTDFLFLRLLTKKLGNIRNDQTKSLIRRDAITVIKFRPKI